MDTMASCNFDGNTDMYGLGIRMGFYLTWLADILAPWVRRREVAGIRVTVSVFIAATFLALLIQTGSDSSSLHPVDIYIILLLTFGQYLSFVPIYFWRILLRCEPDWDPSRYPRVLPAKDYSFLNFLLLVAVSGYQLYFWFVRVPELDKQEYPEYGFLFSKIRLNEKPFQVVNMIFHFLLLISCLVVVLITIGIIEEIPPSRPTTSSAHRELMQQLETAVRVIVISTVITATELTVLWNEIGNVNSVATAGQIIPFLIGLSSVVRIFYLWRFSKKRDIKVFEGTASVTDFILSRQPRG